MSFACNIEQITVYIQPNASPTLEGLKSRFDTSLRSHQSGFSPLCRGHSSEGPFHGESSQGFHPLARRPPHPSQHIKTTSLFSMTISCCTTPSRLSISNNQGRYFYITAILLSYCFRIAQPIFLYCLNNHRAILHPYNNNTPVFLSQLFYIVFVSAKQYFNMREAKNGDK